jgi:hypothetical protein
MDSMEEGAAFEEDSADITVSWRPSDSAPIKMGVRERFRK